MGLNIPGFIFYAFYYVLRIISLPLVKKSFSQKNSNNQNSKNIFLRNLGF